MKNKAFKRTAQTITYLPHFISLVVACGMISDFCLTTGLFNDIITFFGGEAQPLLQNPAYFRTIYVASGIWQEVGWGSIIYLSALSSVDSQLYEAAAIDGANRWKQTLHVTLPGILPIVALMSILAMGNIFNAGFDQIFNMYSPQVYGTGDILDTLVYRIGMLDAQYGVATAIGLFKSVISFAMLASAYVLAYKFTDYRVF